MKKAERSAHLDRRFADAEKLQLSQDHSAGYMAAELLSWLYGIKLPKGGAWLRLGAKGEQLGVVRTLQKGGHTLQSATLKVLNLTKGQANKAIHAMKEANRIPNNLHGIITSNGDYLHPHTRKVLGNILEYV